MNGQEANSNLGHVLLWVHLFVSNKKYFPHCLRPCRGLEDTEPWVLPSKPKLLTKSRKSGLWAALRTWTPAELHRLHLVYVSKRLVTAPCAAQILRVLPCQAMSRSKHLRVFFSFLFSPGENHWERCLGTEWKNRQKFHYIILHQIFSENQISSFWNVMTVDQVVGQLTVAHVWCSWHTDTHTCLS